MSHRLYGCASMAVLVAGCSTGSPQAPRPFAACVLAPTDDADPYTVGASATLSGNALDAGSGDDLGCFDGMALISAGDVDRDTAWWVQLADASQATWTVGVWFPDAPTGPAAGDPLTVDVSYTFGGFGPTIGWVDLRDDVGNGIAYVGLGGDLSDLPDPPEMTLSLGAASGHDSDSCGSWTSYDLEVDGETVPYGSVAKVGGAEVRHGGIDLQDGPMSCPDAFVAHAAVGVVD